MTAEGKRPGPESTRDDVRAQLIDAGVAMLAESGVSIGLDHLRLQTLIDAVGVTRATAYRSLADDHLDPQDKLRFEVLSRLLERESGPENTALVSDAISAVLDTYADHLNSDDLATRSWVLRELIRKGSEASFGAVSSSRERAILFAAYGSITSQQEDAPQWQIDQLQKGETFLVEIFSAIYEAMSELFQMRLRPHLTTTQLATAIAAAVEGTALRSKVNDALSNIMLPTGPAGEMVPWSLHGLTVEALVVRFYEPIDAEDPYVDLTVLF